MFPMFTGMLSIWAVWSMRQCDLSDSGGEMTGRCTDGYIMTCLVTNINTGTACVYVRVCDDLPSSLIILANIHTEWGCAMLHSQELPDWPGVHTLCGMSYRIYVMLMQSGDHTGQTVAKTFVEALPFSSKEALIWEAGDSRPGNLRPASAASDAARPRSSSSDWMDHVRLLRQEDFPRSSGRQVQVLET